MDVQSLSLWLRHGLLFGADVCDETIDMSEVHVWTISPRVGHGWWWSWLILYEEEVMFGCEGSVSCLHDGGVTSPIEEWDGFNELQPLFSATLHKQFNQFQSLNESRPSTKHE